VRAYIDRLGPEHRRLFDRLQDLILAVVPDAQVVISYQIPLYKVGKLHVGLSARRAGGVTLTTNSRPPRVKRRYRAPDEQGETKSAR
jgi:hypothetical protein